MKKQFIISVIITMVLIVGLSGCTENGENSGDVTNTKGIIVFISTDGLTHVINPDGSNEINLNKLMWPLYGWSENREQLLLITLTAEDGIYTLNDDGTLRYLNKPKLFGDVNVRSYSSNLEKCLLYENGSYYVSNMDGNNKVKIFDTDKQVQNIILSPTGKKVAFLMPVDIEDYYEKDFNLYIINSDGTGKKSIALCSENAFSPYYFGITFSPDESKITYNNKYEIHIIDVDGNNDYFIGRGPDKGTTPVWSYDSKKIAYHSNDGIYIINIDGTGKTLIRSIDTGHQSIWGLSWAHNGERIAYSITENFDTDPKIYVCNVDGSSSNHIAYGSNPYWSLT